jgi:hypothetical protein
MINEIQKLDDAVEFFLGDVHAKVLPCWLGKIETCHRIDRPHLGSSGARAPIWGLAAVTGNMERREPPVGDSQPILQDNLCRVRIVTHEAPEPFASFGAALFYARRGYALRLKFTPDDIRANAHLLLNVRKRPA